MYFHVASVSIIIEPYRTSLDSSLDDREVKCRTSFHLFFCSCSYLFNGSTPPHMLEKSVWRNSLLQFLERKCYKNTSFCLFSTQWCFALAILGMIKKIKVRKIGGKKGNNTSKKYTIKEIKKISVSVVSRNEPMNEIGSDYFVMQKGLQKEECCNTSKRKELLVLYQQ